MRLLGTTLATAGGVLAVLAYEAQVGSIHASGLRATAHVAIGLSFLFGGLVARWRRPTNRLGSLMAAAGFALILRQLRYSHDALAFTLFFLLSGIGFAFALHAVLNYPSGRITDSLERIVVRAAYVAVLAIPLAVLLVHDVPDRLEHFGSLERKSDVVIVASTRAGALFEHAYAVVLGVLAVVLVGLVGRRLAAARVPTRRLLAPLALAAVAFGFLASYELAFAFGDPHLASRAPFWGYVLSFVALPPAMAAGLVRARRPQARIGDLVVQLERSSPQGLRTTLAEGLGDPSLQIVFWLPERATFADEAGHPVVLPADDPRRAVTRLEHDGEPIAALIHDPALRDEPELVEAAAAAARLALENARLSAELRAQLQKVEESRSRIIAATDAERRRIERDIHDGAQQRLVGVALGLRSAQRQLLAAGETDVERALDASVAEIQAAVEELRELARGVHPATLTDDGLAAALESLALRAPLPVDLVQAPEQRLSPEVEAAAYFVACEGLANVAKHAGASSAAVSAARRDGMLVVEVADDGVGGAALDGGSGLRGLADRVEALGGRLEIDSRAAAGTRIVAEIPCAS